MSDYLKISELEFLSSDTFDYSVGSYLTSEEFKTGLAFYFSSFSFPESDDTETSFHTMFNFWKSSRLPEFTSMYTALRAEYNPIENYDRYEESADTDEHHKGSKETYTDSGSSENSKSGADTLGRSGKVTETDDLTRTDALKETSSGTSANGVYSFDSSGSLPHDTGSVSGESENTGTVKNTGTKTTEDGRTETTTYGSKDTGSTKGSGERHYLDESDTVFDHDTNSHTAHLHGNIGVTTSQEMVTAELKLRDPVFLKKYILSDFADRVLFMAEGV